MECSGLFKRETCAPLWGNNMKSISLLLGITLWLLLPSALYAQSPNPCPSPGTYGCFEVGLPGSTKLQAGQSIESFVGGKDNKPILEFIGIAVNVVVALVVIIGVISIVVGGYIYMTAGGNASQVGTAKEVIKAALLGIVIALTSVVILNTINRFLGSDAIEPELGDTQSGAAGAGTGGGSETSLGAGGIANGGSGGLPGSAASNTGDSLAGGNENPTGGIADGGSNGTSTDAASNTGSSVGNTGTSGTGSSALQSISITIDDRTYYVNGTPATLEEITSLAQSTTGDPDTGVRAHIYRTGSAKFTAEQTLYRALNNTGIDNNSMNVPTQLVDGPQ